MRAAKSLFNQKEFSDNDNPIDVNPSGDVFVKIFIFRWNGISEWGNEYCSD